MSELDYVLVGERVALGPPRRDLAERYARWVNDVDNGRTLGFIGVQALAAEEEYIDEAIKASAGRRPEARTSPSTTSTTASPLAAPRSWASTTRPARRASGSSSASARAAAWAPMRRA